MRLIRSYLSPTRQTERNTFHLLLQNAAALFAYWHLDARKIALIHEHFGCDWTELGPSIRLYDITGLPFDGSKSNEILQVSVKEQTSCYIHGLKQGRVYIADFGIWNKEKQFLPLLRSNCISTPWDENSKTSVDNFISLDDAHLGSMLLPSDYNQFSAYTIYPLTNDLRKKTDADTGVN